MGRGDQCLFILTPHFEIKPHRFCSEAPDENANLQKVVKSSSALEVAFEMDTRKPNLQLVKHHAVLQANFTKQFGLGVLKEANVCAVEYDARGVDVAPPHTLFNREFLVARHQANTLSRNLNKAKLKCSVCSRFETCPAFPITTRRDGAIFDCIFSLSA